MSVTARIVGIDTSTVRPAMPLRAARGRVAAPTPMMASVSVCGVPLSPPYHGVIAPGAGAPPLHTDRDHREHDDHHDDNVDVAADVRNHLAKKVARPRQT